MPEKQTKANKRYKVSGKTFEWTTEDGDTVTMPMRLKLKVIRSMAGREDDVEAMFEIIDKVAPNQGDVLDEMDVNDFVAMFRTWQQEYNALSGATLGE